MGKAQGISKSRVAGRGCSGLLGGGRGRSPEGALFSARKGRCPDKSWGLEIKCKF